jgi:hypothetical protein
MSVIFATQEAEIRRIAVRSQPGQIVCEILSRKNPSQKRADGVAQGEGPEFKPHTAKEKIFFLFFFNLKTQSYVPLMIHENLGLCHQFIFLSFGFHNAQASR